jgi:hypothetical protein
MDVPLVRRALGALRSRWEDTLQGRPFYMVEALPDDIAPGLPIQRFSLLFVHGHHTKRCRRRGAEEKGDEEQRSQGAPERAVARGE